MDPEYVQGLEAVHESEGTWVTAGKVIVNMANVTCITPLGQGYTLYLVGDPDGVDLTVEEAADVLIYVTRHACTWAKKAE